MPPMGAVAETYGLAARLMAAFVLIGFLFSALGTAAPPAPVPAQTACLDCPVPR
jgi:hypothetical protein